MVNADQVPPSRRHANSRPEGGVRLSVPVNVNIALVTCAAPPGPPAIWVSGGVLSTMMARVIVAEFPARSVAAAPSVCEPSLTVDVSQVAVAVAPGAGRGGATGLGRDPPPTVITSEATPLPPALAFTWRPTASPTEAPPPGALESSVGARTS